jgi:ADP-ribosylglycohydrolase
MNPQQEEEPMYLSIVGDVLGSTLEFDPQKPKKDKLSLITLALIGRPTDDSIMTLATWQWWADYRAGKAGIADYFSYLKRFLDLTPNIGYGHKFFHLMADGTEPDPPSCGNGAAMRISALGVSSGYSMDDIMELVEKLTLQTHKHPEAVKGAQAVVYASKTALENPAVSREEISREIESKFGYNLNLDYDELLTRSFDATCQGSVPQAIWCALSSSNVAEVFTKAMTIGGDTDTIACIAGGIFQATCSSPGQISAGDSGCSITIAAAMANAKLRLPAEIGGVMKRCKIEFSGCRELP